MPLLAATSALDLGEDAGVLLYSVIYTVSVPLQMQRTVTETRTRSSAFAETTATPSIG